MALFLRVYFDRNLALLLAGAGLLCALVSAPLIRSLPEAQSIRLFFVLVPLQIGFGLGGMVLGPAQWQRTRDWRALAAFGFSLAVFVLLAINFSTDWLWPRPTS